MSQQMLLILALNLIEPIRNVNLINRVNFVSNYMNKLNGKACRMEEFKNRSEWI
jgi:hypothetical protein